MGETWQPCCFVEPGCTETMREPVEHIMKFGSPLKPRIVVRQHEEIAFPQ